MDVPPPFPPCVLACAPHLSVVTDQEVEKSFSHYLASRNCMNTGGSATKCECIKQLNTHVVIYKHIAEFLRAVWSKLDNHQRHAYALHHFVPSHGWSPTTYRYELPFVPDESLRTSVLFCPLALASMLLSDTKTRKRMVGVLKKFWFQRAEMAATIPPPTLLQDRLLRSILREATQAKQKQKRKREIDDLVIPGSLPLTGIDWHGPIKEMSLSSAYGLQAVTQQPTRMVICNNNEPFYAEGTGIEKVALHFVPKNMQFPNDRLFDRAAASARALVVAVFGGGELISQRNRRYSAPEFHTVSMVDMTMPPTTSKPVNKCISALYFTQVEGTRSMWIEWFGTDWGYRGKNLGIGTLLLQFILDLAIIDEGVDDVYLEVGQDKEGKMENWKAARHVYEKVGFAFMENIRIPGEVAGRCKHFGDDYYNVMCYDCKGKAPSRMSTRQSTRRSIRSRLAP